MPRTYARPWNAPGFALVAKIPIEDLGKPSGHADQMLAGHAKFEKAVVVTNNTKDFKHVHGLKIEDWIAPLWLKARF